jgi:rubrerythrin
MDNEKCIDVCNSLLRGEISAIETYQQAIEKFDQGSEAVKLQEIKSNHIESARILEEHIRKLGGEPVDHSGIWGMFAKAVEGGAKLFGENSALSALKQGEETGRSQYESAIDNEDVMSDFKPVIKSELLPRQIQHIEQLDSIMASNQS